MPDDDIKLTEREMAIARMAAEIAVKQLADEFYKGVGRNVVKKFFVWLGLGVIGFAAGHGWIKWSP